MAEYSPISRRAFLRNFGAASVSALPVAVALGTVVASAVSEEVDPESLKQFDEGDKSCGYCNGSGRNYYHCDGNYCNYINYTDSSYSNYANSYSYGDSCSAKAQIEPWLRPDE